MTSEEYLPGQAEYIAQRMAGKAEFEAEFEYIFSRLRRVHPIEAGARILEIGAGLGWFEVFAELNGFKAEAIEHNPRFIEVARELAAEFSVQPRIHLADAQTWDYGSDQWDVIVATSVLEHIREYRPVLHHAYRALRQGGLLYIYTTNKWSLRSGEYTEFPLYGWLPYSVRERIRVKATGDRGVVTRGGIDFNQFTYWGLRRDLRRAGFSRIVDRVDLAHPDHLSTPTATKRFVVRVMQKAPSLRLPIHMFSGGNEFVAVKE